MKANNKKQKPFSEVDTSMSSYENHAFFVKKAKDSKALLKTVGLPKQLKKTK